MKIIRISAVVTLSIAIFPAACSSSDDPKPGPYTEHSSPYPSCDAIIKACHPYDVGEGDIHDCHDQGHEAHSDADCAPVKQQCLDLCAAAADGGTADASAH